ncbi:MAG: Proteasome subunit beta type-5 [Marteilia pararefringens]
MQSMRANNITFEMHQFRNLKFSSHLLHGTTTLAFIYKNGIIVAVDSRATAGSIIATHNIKKIIEFSPGILGTMAGNAAACQHAGVSLSHQIKIFTMRNDKQPSMTVCGRLLQSFFRETNSGHGTSGMMLCGFDHKGPQIVYCDSELNFLNFEKFSIGSGMQSALAVLFDEEDIYNVEDEKAYEIARHAIKVAASRDAGSGGCSMGISIFFSILRFTIIFPGQVGN